MENPFSCEKYFKAPSEILGDVSEYVADRLRAEGYEVEVEEMIGNDRRISLFKGGMFKKCLGLQTALKVELLEEGDAIHAKASIGIFGQQAIPTIIMMFVTWPVIVTQIIGLIKQSKLDDTVMELISEGISANKPKPARKRKTKNGDAEFRYCPECGAEVSGGKFCSECGTSLQQ